MAENKNKYRALITVTEIEMAEIQILAADREDCAAFVAKVLERKEVDRLEELDTLTLKNLSGFLQTL